MSLHRRNPKRDENEREIIDALKAMGVCVYQLDKPLDLLCWWPGGEYFLIEVKDGNKPPSKRNLTDAQADFFVLAPLGNTRICINVSEAVDFAEEMR